MDDVGNWDSRILASAQGVSPKVVPDPIPESPCRTQNVSNALVALISGDVQELVLSLISCPQK